MSTWTRTPRLGTSPRHAYADNLKVLMVVGVIVAHVTFAWTGVGTWVFEETPLREPLLSLVTLLAVVGGLFGLALFFLLAGEFTPPSFARKGTARFLLDRVVRLGVPMVFFVIAFSPFIEYVDPDNADWTRGFGAFALHIWRQPAPGPTWFLGVLLVFSIGYAVVRTLVPLQARPPAAMRLRHLALAAVTIAVASYLVRLGVPLGAERYRLALGQAPSWVVAFVLGVLGSERGWFASMPPRLVRTAGGMALAALVAVVAVFLGVALTDGDPDAFGGGGTWQSLLMAVLEAPFVVGLSVWLPALFKRRFDHQGRLAREMSRSAYAAFLIHQPVLVVLVLATREVSWPPEVDFFTVAVVGVAATFALAGLLVRLPGVSRVV